MSRHDITAEPWAVIEPVIPKQKPGPGRKRTHDRHTRNGIRFVLKTGCPWEDVPRAYGSPATCWRRCHHGAADGTWEQIWRALVSQLDARGKLEWTPAFLDGSCVPATKGARGSATRSSARAAQ